MKKYRKVLTLVVLFFIVNIFCFTAKAGNNYCKDNALNNVFSDKVSAITSDNVRSAVDEFGINDFSAEELNNISLDDVFKLIKNTFSDRFREPAKCMCSIFGVLIFTSAAGCYISKNSNMSQYFDTVTTIFISCLIFSYISACINNIVTSIYSMGLFMKSLVPIMAAVITYSGNPAMAVGYNSITLYVSEIMCSFCEKFFSPILCIFAAVAVCGCVNPFININGVLSGVKKLLNTMLGLIGTVFTGIMSIKNVLSSNLDRISYKGIKFILGTAVPVVGNTVSDGLSSVVASVSLMKNTYGMIGLIIIFIISLPAVCELIMWKVTLAALAYSAEALDNKKTAEVLLSLQFVMSIMFSIVVFLVYVSIVSTALVILLSGK